MQKRLLSVILSMSLVLSEVPTAALAEAIDDTSAEEVPQLVVEDNELTTDETPEDVVGSEVTPEVTPEEVLPEEPPAEELTEELPAEELPAEEPQEEPEAVVEETAEEATEEAVEETAEPAAPETEAVEEPAAPEAPAEAEELELTAQATLPKMNAAITEANALAILKAYDSDGDTMVTFTKNAGSAKISQWLQGMQSNAEALDMVVHEECHAYSSGRPSGYNEEAIYTGNGNYITVNMQASVTIFPSSEMAAKIPESLRTFRYKTYVSSSSTTSSNYNGPYGLLNELNAYSWGLNNQLKLFGYYRDYRSDTEPVDVFGQFLTCCINDKNAYAEFRYWTLRYLSYAKTNHPEVYQHFLNDQDFLDAYTVTQRRFEALISQIDDRVSDITAWGKERGYTVWVENGMLWQKKGNSSRGVGERDDAYKLLMAEIAKSEYQEIDQAIQSRAHVFLMSKAKVSSVASQPYTGKAYKPKPTVTYEGKTLKNGTDYTLSYKNNVNAGTATITITGLGTYVGTKKVTFKITPIALTGGKVGSISNQKYTGQARKPSPKVTLNGKTLTAGTDYKLTYKKNTLPGTATAIVTGTGNYTGTLKRSFKIVAMAGTWKKSGGRWWYQWKDGKYPANVWLMIGGKYYRFDGSGWMLTGWQKVSNKWYYLGSDGAMRTGWLNQGGARYWLKSTGAMATGWQTISGKTYYFESSGAMAKSKWVGNYYLQADGTMAVNKWIGRYHVDANGKWDKTR